MKTNSVFVKKFLRSSLTILICVLFSITLANASGGEGGGGGNGGAGGSGGSGGGNSGGGNSGGSGGGGGGSSNGGGEGRGGVGDVISEPISYDLGKKYFAEVVVCGTCPFADLVLEPDQVRTEWKQIKRALKPKGEIGKDLSQAKRRSIRRYIKKRFIKQSTS